MKSGTFFDFNLQFYINCRLQTHCNLFKPPVFGWQLRQSSKKRKWRKNRYFRGKIWTVVEKWFWQNGTPLSSIKTEHVSVCLIASGIPLGVTIFDRITIRSRWKFLTEHTAEWCNPCNSIGRSIYKRMRLFRCWYCSFSLACQRHYGTHVAQVEPAAISIEK